jgi:hypothetical protein
MRVTKIVTPEEIKRTASTAAEMASRIGRSCGSCTLCCKILEIEPDYLGADEVDITKPSGHGASTASRTRGARFTRPAHAYAVASPACGSSAIGTAWTGSRGAARCCSYPTARAASLSTSTKSSPAAWRKQPYHTDLTAIATTEPVWIYIGDRQILLFRDKELEVQPGDTITLDEHGVPRVTPAGVGARLEE